MQITKSEYVTLCGICSPCFPDQGDLTSEGDFLTYCLPADLLPEDFKNTIVKYDENFTKLVNHFMVFPFVRSEKESVYIIFDIIKFIGEKNTWNNETKQLDCFDILGYTPPSYIEYSELCYEEEESIKEYYKEDLKQDLPNDDEIEKIAEKLLKDRYYIYPLTGSNSIVIILDK